MNAYPEASREIVVARVCCMQLEIPMPDGEYTKRNQERWTKPWRLEAFHLAEDRRYHGRKQVRIIEKTYGFQPEMQLEEQRMEYICKTLTEAMNSGFRKIAEKIALTRASQPTSSLSLPAGFFHQPGWWYEEKQSSLSEGLLLELWGNWSFPLRLSTAGSSPDQSR